jgi:hypothetical protein
MSESVTSKKQCVTCDKSGGTVICDGCQQSFCIKHVSEHRQELGVQLDVIMQEHDLLREELEKPSAKKNRILKKIDKWEKDSIAKIQTAAENARKALQELLEQSKERLTKVCHDVSEALRSSREADNFSEHDLDQWKKQLQELQSEITSPSSAKLIQDKGAPIYRMILKIDEPSKNQSASSNEPPPTTNSDTLDLQERFLQTIGPVNLEEHSYLAKCVGSRTNFACIRGRFLYSKGCYLIRFKIEQSKQPYRIFFGCMSFQGSLKENAFKSPHAVGWFGSNQVYEHGRCSTNCQKYGYYSTMIAKDELHLTIDCDNKQIRLFHERTKMTCVLSVNDKLAPFPWQYLVVLCNPGDSVRILPNS